MPEQTRHCEQPTGAEAAQLKALQTCDIASIRAELANQELKKAISSLVLSRAGLQTNNTVLVEGVDYHIRGGHKGPEHRL